MSFKYEISNHKSISFDELSGFRSLISMGHYLWHMLDRYKVLIVFHRILSLHSNALSSIEKKYSNVLYPMHKKQCYVSAYMQECKMVLQYTMSIDIHQLMSCNENGSLILEYHKPQYLRKLSLEFPIDLSLLKGHHSGCQEQGLSRML